MSKITAINKLAKEDFPGDKPAWLDQFLLTLNAFMQTVFSALSGRLTFADNFQCVDTTIKLTSGTDQAINPKSKLHVAGVMLIGASGANVSQFGWNRKSDGTITVNATFSGGGSYVSRLIILLE